MENDEEIQINKPLMSAKEVNAVKTVISSGLLTNKAGSGKNVREFQGEFAKYIGTDFAFAVNSGTSALLACLMEIGVGRGDEVILPSFTFVATAEVVVLLGATPVFVDIEPETYTVDASEVWGALSSKTKAIIPVHLYGLPCDIEEIVKIAKEREGISVIEDACQAHGATYHGKRVGSIGDFGCFSFYGSKNMTTGEGGMITTNHFTVLQSIRNHGESDLYSSSRIGFNFRMPEIEAAIGKEQLKKLPKFLATRKRNAKLLQELLSSNERLVMPIEPAGCESAWYVFTVRLLETRQAVMVKMRNRIVERLQKKGIGAQVYYPIPCHQMLPYMEFPRARPDRLHLTELAAKQVFSLPIHAGLSEQDMIRVARIVNEVM